MLINISKYGASMAKESAQNSKECVASITGLYKNNGAVSCVGKYFPFIQQLYPARTQVITVQNYTWK